MPAYDSAFRPPAPVPEVTVTHPVNAARRVLSAKLDTGADVTAIPITLATELDLPPAGHAWIRGFDGSYSRRLVYYPRLTVEGHELSAVRCVANQRSTLLLGRNVLNRFVILLNGPDLTFEVRLP